MKLNVRLSFSFTIFIYLLMLVSSNRLYPFDEITIASTILDKGEGASSFNISIPDIPSKSTYEPLSGYFTITINKKYLSEMITIFCTKKQYITSFMRVTFNKESTLKRQVRTELEKCIEMKTSAPGFRDYEKKFIYGLILNKKNYMPISNCEISNTYNNIRGENISTGTSNFRLFFEKIKSDTSIYLYFEAPGYYPTVISFNSDVFRGSANTYNLPNVVYMIPKKFDSIVIKSSPDTASVVLDSNLVVGKTPLPVTIGEGELLSHKQYSMVLKKGRFHYLKTVLDCSKVESIPDTFLLEEYFPRILYLNKDSLAHYTKFLFNFNIPKIYTDPSYDFFACLKYNEKEKFFFDKDTCYYHPKKIMIKVPKNDFKITSSKDNKWYTGSFTLSRNCIRSFLGEKIKNQKITFTVYSQYPQGINFETNNPFNQKTLSFGHKYFTHNSFRMVYKINNIKYDKTKYNDSYNNLFRPFWGVDFSSRVGKWFFGGDTDPSIGIILKGSLAFTDFFTNKNYTFLYENPSSTIPYDTTLVKIKQSEVEVGIGVSFTNTFYIKKIPISWYYSKICYIYKNNCLGQNQNSFLTNVGFNKSFFNKKLNFSFYYVNEKKKTFSLNEVNADVMNYTFRGYGVSFLFNVYSFSFGYDFADKKGIQNYLLKTHAFFVEYHL